MTDPSEPWPDRRRRLLARAHAAADASAGARARLPVTSASPGFGGLLGELLGEREAERRERGRAFLAAAEAPSNGRVWERVEQVLVSRLPVHQAVVVRLSPVLVLATPNDLLRPYRAGASEVLLDIGVALEADEIVIEPPNTPESRSGGPPPVVHIAPLDLELGFEQDRYCQLRCESTPPDVARDVVRMLLRT